MLYPQALQSSPLLVTSISFGELVSDSAEVVSSANSLRTVDDYVQSQASREVLFDQRIMDFLTAVVEGSTVLRQSQKCVYLACQFGQSGCAGHLTAGQSPQPGGSLLPARRQAFESLLQARPTTPLPLA